MSRAPEKLPATPEEAGTRAKVERFKAEIRAAVERERRWRAYRKATRPYRRAFRGIITRKDAERLFIQRARKTQRAIEEATNAAG